MDNGLKSESEYDLGKVSEIARQALKQLVSNQTPAIPPYYERFFYNIALEMDETELISQLMKQLPPGQVTMLLVQGVSSMLTDINTNMQEYKEGLVHHDQQLTGKQDKIQNLVSPEIFSLIESDLKSLHENNLMMHQKLEDTEKKMQHQKEQILNLQQKSKSDPLTGAMNRLAMDEDFPSYFSENREANGQFSVIMCDIDHFKKVNDTYGHQLGDQVLKTFYQVLHKALTTKDVVYRYGGEEFLLYLPSTLLPKALEKARYLQKCLEKQVFRHKSNDGFQIQVTASFGVTSIKDSDVSYHEIIRRADKALYEAKSSGRNCVQAFH